MKCKEWQYSRPRAQTLRRRFVKQWGAIGCVCKMPKQHYAGGNRTASLRALVCMVTSQVNWNADDGRRRNQITSFPRADGLCRVQRSFDDDYLKPGVART